MAITNKQLEILRDAFMRKVDVKKTEYKNSNEHQNFKAKILANYNKEFQLAKEYNDLIEKINQLDSQKTKIRDILSEKFINLKYNMPKNMIAWVDASIEMEIGSDLNGKFPTKYDVESQIVLQDLAKSSDILTQLSEYFKI